MIQAWSMLAVICTVGAGGALLLGGCQSPEAGDRAAPSPAPVPVLSPEEVEERIERSSDGLPPGDWEELSVPLGARNRPLDPAG